MTYNHTENVAHFQLIALCLNIKYNVKITFIKVNFPFRFCRERRKAVNQTEIIYSVFANDKPVLAVTAAEDMKLVSDIEVETILDKDVIMKAERKIC